MVVVLARRGVLRGRVEVTFAEGAPKLSLHLNTISMAGRGRVLVFLTVLFLSPVVISTT